MTKQASSTKGMKGIFSHKVTDYNQTAVHLIAFQRQEPRNKTLTSYETF